MPTLLAAISSARSLANEIGEPRLIRMLDDLLRLSDELGMNGQRGSISDSYALLGLSLAYVWDDHSSRFRDALVKILVIAESSNSEPMIDACRELEKRFMTVSHQVEYLEIACGQKLNWA